MRRLRWFRHSYLNGPARLGAAHLRLFDLERAAYWNPTRADLWTRVQRFRRRLDRLAAHNARHLPTHGVSQ